MFSEIAHVIVPLQLADSQGLCHIGIVFAAISKLSYVDAVSVGQPKLTPPKWIKEKRAAHYRRSATQTG